MRFTPQMRALDWLVARPIAHRGLHDATKGILENTRAAFAAALAKRYAIECDVQLTKDGEAVVFHDDTVERLTNAKGPVRSFTMKELQALKLNGSKDRMQKLGELLDQVSGQVPLIIELKSQWTGDISLARQALHCLSGYAGPHAVMSFDPDLVEAIAVLSQDTVRGITADRATDAYYGVLPVAKRVDMRRFSHLTRTKPHFVSFAFRELPFAPVQAIRASGFPVVTWTIRSRIEEAQARRYCDQVTFEGYHA
jgi:glycerophosphoryl diester phosphodiesterase